MNHVLRKNVLLVTAITPSSSFFSYVQRLFCPYNRMKKTFFVTIFNVVVILYPIEGQKKKRTSNLSSILLHFFLLKYERKKKNHRYNIDSYSTTKVLMLPLLAVLLKVLFFLFIKSKKNRKEKKRLSRAFMFQGMCEYYIKNAKRSRRKKKKSVVVLFESTYHSLFFDTISKQVGVVHTCITWKYLQEFSL